MAERGTGSTNSTGALQLGGEVLQVRQVGAVPDDAQHDVHAALVGQRGGAHGRAEPVRPADGPGIQDVEGADPACRRSWWAG